MLGRGTSMYKGPVAGRCVGLEGCVARRWACSVGRGRAGAEAVLEHLVNSIKEGQREPWKTLKSEGEGVLN